MNASFKQSTLLDTGRRNTTRQLRDNVAINRIKAVIRFTFPEVSGRVFVRWTFLSIFMSQRSLIMHPAPLVKMAPATIKLTRFFEGGAEGVSHRDHPAGINKMSLPLGLFQRRRYTQCLSCLRECWMFTDTFF